MRLSCGAQNRRYFSLVVRAFLVVSVTVALALQASPAWAPCPPPNTFEGQVRWADAVWVGTILKARVTDGQSASNWRLSVRVQEVLKGPSVRQPVTVFTGFGGPYRSPEHAPALRKELEGSRNVFTVRGPDEAGGYHWTGPDGCGGNTPPGQYLERAWTVLGIGDRPDWLVTAALVAIVGGVTMLTRVWIIRRRA